jgi:hypothetical protein
LGGMNKKTGNESISKALQLNVFILFSLSIIKIVFDGNGFAHLKEAPIVSEGRPVVLYGCEASSLTLMEQTHRDNFAFYRNLRSEFVEVSINERVNGLRECFVTCTLLQV